MDDEEGQGSVMHFGPPETNLHDPSQSFPDESDVLLAARGKFAPEHRPWSAKKEAPVSDSEFLEACGLIKGLVCQLTNPEETEDKRDEAFVLLQLAIVSKQEGIKSHLLPIVLGRLWRKVRNEAVVCNETALIELLLRQGYDREKLSYFRRDAYELLEHPALPGSVKLLLLEFFATNNASPDSIDLLPTMLNVVLRSKEDKIRACALFGLRKQMRHRYGNTVIFDRIKNLLTLAWNEQYEYVDDPYDYSDDNKDESQKEAERKAKAAAVEAELADMPPFGPLAKLASAHLLCNTVVRPPLAAIRFLLENLQEPMELNALWATGPEGGDWVVGSRTGVNLEDCIDEKFLPLIESKLQEIDEGIAKKEKEAKETTNDPILLFVEKRRRILVCDYPPDWSLGGLILNTLEAINGGYTKKVILPELLKFMKMPASEAASNRYMVAFCVLTFDEPLPEGVIPQELEPAQSAFLAELANGEYDLLWDHTAMTYDKYKTYLREKEERESILQVENMNEKEGAKMDVSDNEDDDQPRAGKRRKLESDQSAIPTPPLVIFGLPTTRTQLQEFLNKPLPPGMEGKKIIPNLDCLDDEDWENLSHAYGAATDVPGLIRALASSSKSRISSALGALYGNICHQGTRYPASVPAAKWIASLLQYERVLCKEQLMRYLVNLSVGFPDAYYNLGFIEDLSSMYTDGLNTYKAIGDQFPIFLEILSSPETSVHLKLNVIALFALYPSKNLEIVPVLLPIMDNDNEHLVLRSSAMSALTLLLIPAKNLSPEEKELREGAVDRILAYMRLLLPAPVGVVNALKDTCIASLVASEGTAGEEKLPEELREVIRKKKAFSKADPALFKSLQLDAAIGLARLVMNRIGVGFAERSYQFYRSDPDEEERQKKEEQKRLDVILSALEDEPLAKWLPNVEAVLLDYVCFPSQFAQAVRNHEEEDAEIANPLFNDNVVQRFIKDSGLFMEPESWVQRILDRFNQKSTGDDLFSMACTMLNMSFRDAGMVHGWSTMQQPEVYDLDKWSPLQKRVLCALIDCDAVWEHKRIGHQLKTCLDVSVTPTRKGLGRAFYGPSYS